MQNTSKSLKLGEALMTQNPAMRGENVYEYEFDIAEVTG